MSDVKPLSAEEEAEVRSHHEPTYYPATATEPEWTQCSWSTGPDEWPCDEARLLATLDAEREARPALDVAIGPIPHSSTFCRQYDADGKGCRCWCLACEQHNAVERGTLVRESQPPDARRGHR